MNHPIRSYLQPRPARHIFGLVGLCCLAVAWAGAGAAAPRPQTSDQTVDLTYQEAQTVYLGNLARQENGVPPLRWNAQLTNAARWFSWDSVENRPEPYCGHQDTTGGWPGDRARTFGYLGGSGAENAFCGYVTPQQAIDGWMDSPGHRANLLDPGSREVGLGYYQRSSDGRGYVAQGFGQDAVYPPVVIENEAIQVASPEVNLYIYDRAAGGGFAEMGAATEMMVSHSACFEAAAWQPYQAEIPWTLEAGQGWRNVYVKTRDSLNRSVTVSDTVYLGQAVPLEQLGAAQMSSTRPAVTLYNLDGNGLPKMQFSLNWFADDTFGTFSLYWGNGARVNDAEAWGGSAFRLSPGDGESFAWVWTTEFIKDTPLVAYFRLKVNDNSADSEVARLAVGGGGTEYGPLSLKGVDFAAAGAYQEFAIPFVFHQSEDVFLIVKFWRSGEADVYVDAVSIFTQAYPLTSPYTWDAPGGNYRGQGVLGRYTDDAGNFSAFQEADVNPPGGIQAWPTALVFTAVQNGAPAAGQMVQVTQTGCSANAWTVSDDADWLWTEPGVDAIEVSVQTSGLGLGAYQATVTIQPEVGPAVSIPVTLQMVDQIYQVYLPVVTGAD